jgi:hypothetical protein
LGPRVSRNLSLKISILQLEALYSQPPSQSKKFPAKKPTHNLGFYLNDTPKQANREFIIIFFYEINVAFLAFNVMEFSKDSVFLRRSVIVEVIRIIECLDLDLLVNGFVHAGKDFLMSGDFSGSFQDLSHSWVSFSGFKPFQGVFSEFKPFLGVFFRIQAFPGCLFQDLSHSRVSFSGSKPFQGVFFKIQAFQGVFFRIYAFPGCLFQNLIHKNHSQ